MPKKFEDAYEPIDDEGLIDIAHNLIPEQFGDLAIAAITCDDEAKILCLDNEGSDEDIGGALYVIEVRKPTPSELEVMKTYAEEHDMLSSDEDQVADDDGNVEPRPGTGAAGRE